MNANLLTIGNISPMSIGMSSVPTKASMASKGNQFFLSRNDKSTKVVPLETAITNNVLTDTRTIPFEEPLHESADVFHEKVKTDDLLTDQDNQSRLQSTVYSANKHANTGPVQGIKNAKHEEQITEVNGEMKVERQNEKQTSDPQASTVSNILGQTIRSADNKHLTVDEGQAESKTTMTNTSENILNAQNHTGSSISSIKPSAFDSFIDGGGQTTTDKEKEATINIDLTLVQAKSTQKQPEIAEMCPDKNVSTTKIVMKSQNMIVKESMHDENDLSNTLASQTFSIGENHIPADRSQERGRSANDNPLNISLELIPSHNSYQTQTAQQSSSMTVSVKTNNLLENDLPSDISADIGKQILELIQSSLPQQDNDRHVIIRLNPPELGEVFIKFQEQNTELIGFIEVCKREIRFEIEQALPEIIRNLSDYGIQIKRLDVMLSEADRSDHAALSNQSLQHNESHEQDSANSEKWADDSDHSEVNERLLNCNSYHHTMLSREVLITDNSINILI